MRPPHAAQAKPEAEPGETEANVAPDGPVSVAMPAPSQNLPDVVPDVKVIQAVGACLCAAVPLLQPELMVDMLEFVAAQHSGKNFEPGKNVDRAPEIIEFLKKSPFAVTREGIKSLAALARHALEKSTEQGKEGNANTAEHQLWLLTSGALNTAAAISAHGGDAEAFFAAVDSGDGVERGKYMQRHYAMQAMQQYVSSAPPSREEIVQKNRDAMVPVSLCLAGFVGAAALGVALFLLGGGPEGVRGGH